MSRTLPFPSEGAGLVRRNWRVGLRLIFAIFWSADAALKWKLILDGVDYATIIAAGSADQPGWLSSWNSYWSGIAKGTPGFAYVIAVFETVIALFLFTGFLTNWVSFGGMVFAFLTWSTAEAFGGIFVQGATDVGTMPLYMAMFAGLIVVQAGRDKGLDAILSRRYKWLPFV